MRSASLNALTAIDLFGAGGNDTVQWTPLSGSPGGHQHLFFWEPSRKERISLFRSYARSMLCT